MLERSFSPPLPGHPFALALAAAAIATAGAVAGVMVATRPSPRAIEVCGLPRGIDFAALGERDRSYALRRAFACADLLEGRMTLADYAARLEALDAAPPVVETSEPIWADHVISFSSQWADDQWSASRALGPPDVFPRSGDHPQAWASREADGAVEHLEVGFTQPRRLKALDIFETYNPGAVSRVEAVTTSGKRLVLYQGKAVPMGQGAHKRHLDFDCTDEAIAAVRLTLDSAAVPGWNEIDAVAAAVCR